MKRFSVILCAFLCILALSGCSLRREADVPEDFSFALTWGTYGVSSYDSRTGKLVKDADAADPDDHVEYHLTAREKAELYALLLSLDANSYPDVYDPGCGGSKPPMSLILTVRADGAEKTIRAEGLAHSFESEDAKGQQFLSVCETIIERLTATKEWQSLPDYENLYR